MNRTSGNFVRICGLSGFAFKRENGFYAVPAAALKPGEVADLYSMKDKLNTSLLMMAGAMLIFGTIGIFRRSIPQSSAVLAFERGIIGAVFLLVLMRLKNHKFAFRTGIRDFLLLVLSGISIGLNWIFLFEAYNYTSVAAATLCYYTAPVIVILVSPVFLREKLTVKKIVCVLSAGFGMLLVSGLPGGESRAPLDMTGLIFGLAAALLYASAVVMNKKIKADDAFARTVIQLLSAALVLFPYLLLTEDFSLREITASSLLMILVVGTVHTGIAYAMYFAALKNLKAQSAAILSYTDPVAALILSALILNEHLTVSGTAGAVLILGSALVSEINFRFPWKKKQSPLQE